MIRKPTTSDPEQREREAERARRSSKLSAAGGNVDSIKKQNQQSHQAAGPAHGSSDGESAHGAIPRSGIEFEQGD